MFNTKVYHFADREEPNTKGDVGIEIEMEGPNPFPQTNSVNWVSTFDGSLRGCSMEYVSNGPIPIEKVGERIDKLKKLLHRNEAEINYSVRAGVHVHVNMTDYTFGQLYRFAICYYILEKCLLEFCGEDRAGNLFCLSADDAEGNLFSAIESLESMKIGRLPYGSFNDNVRYSACNWTSLTKFGTLEFRALSTVPKLDNIEPWCDMLVELRNNSINYDTPHDILSEVSILGPLEWCKKMLGKHFVHIEGQKDLENTIMEGTWMVHMFVEKLHTSETYVRNIGQVDKVKKIKKKNRPNLNELYHQNVDFRGLEAGVRLRRDPFEELHYIANANEE